MKIEHWVLERTRRNKRPYLLGVVGEEKAVATSPVVLVVSSDPPVLRTFTGTEYELGKPLRPTDVDELLKALVAEFDYPPYPPMEPRA